MKPKRRQVFKWILLSAIVLGHIVIATEDVAAAAEMPASDSDQESQNTDNNAELQAKSAPEETQSLDEEQQSPQEKPPWSEDSGGNATAPQQHPPENNFSQAFNLKHLIYFENASQNNGCVIAGSASGSGSVPMHSVWCKYIYNKIKMKNLPILLILYWATMQIYAIVSLLDGIPSAPSPSSIYNIMEKAAPINSQLDSRIASQLETLHLNDTNGGSSDGKDVAAVQPEEAVEEDSLKHRPSEDGDELEFKDELIHSGAIEPTPLAHSDLVTEDPSQATADEKTNATATTTAEEHPIPVFSEWAKQMEKAEKKQEQDVANASTNKHRPADRQGRSSAPKIRAKNYASPDCGAKIIAANQESDNTGHVLSASKDEYLISICTSRIWFVVELCEPIQAEKVELANFELFSSSPKEFSVSVSNRYPTRDWSDVGQFVAKDERTIQHFELNPKLFGKFVRVDIHSHYNTEHFCPVSLFRVQGTSEFEAFETADQKLPLDDYDDDEEGGAVAAETKGGDNNLFKSASDAVLSMVKKAAQVLSKGEEHKSVDAVKVGRSDLDHCLTLANVVACPGGRESLTRDVTELLTCKAALLESLWRWQLVKQMVYKTELCYELIGVQLMRPAEEEKEEGRNSRDPRRDFVARLLPEAYLMALCNVAAGEERLLRRVEVRVDSGTSEEGEAEGQKKRTMPEPVNNLTIDGPGLMEEMPLNVQAPFHGEPGDPRLIFVPKEEEEGEGEDERRNCEREAVEVEVHSPVEGGERVSEVVSEGPWTSAPEPSEVATQVDRPPEAVEGGGGGAEGGARKEVKSDEVVVPPPAAGDAWKGNGNGGGENVLEEGGNLQQKVHGESVFLRLSSRIKALERNMSLSSQYLEELSRRYKKQVEELQQSLAKTILSFEETTRQTVEDKQQLADENARLRQDIAEVLENFVAWKSILFYLVVFVCIQIVLFTLLLLLYIKNRIRERRRERKREEEEAQLRCVESRRMSVAVDAKAGRRNSTEGISVSSRSTTSLSEGKRRPSEEALQIAGTYSELLIVSPPAQVGVPLIGGSSTGSGHKKKARNRKSSLPNQVYQVHAEQQATVPGRLMHSTSVNGYHQERHPQSRDGGASAVDGSEASTVLLEENDEFYLPGSDLSYVEYVPEEGEDNGGGAAQKKKKDSRRLSSPAFLRTALSRSVRQSKKNAKKEASRKSPDEEDVQSTTSNSSWDWYKLRRVSSTTSSQAAKSLAGCVANGSVSLSSQDSVNPELTSVEGGEEEENGEEEEEVAVVVATPKKTTKFRKIFRKVF